MRAVYFVGETVVIETNPIKAGEWEIIWVDQKGGEKRTFATDTSIYHIGYSMKTLIKL
jgi:hypothetical protein